LIDVSKMIHFVKIPKYLSLSKQQTIDRSGYLNRGGSTLLDNCKGLKQNDHLKAFNLDRGVKKNTVVESHETQTPKIGIQPLGTQSFRFQSLGFQSHGIQSLGIQSLVIQSLGIQSLDIQSLGVSLVELGFLRISHLILHPCLRS
jgi:hypothetical protein